MTAVNEEKISFILYGSYEEQLNMLTDKQAGQWIKGVYHYINTGEKHHNDPMVKMLLSVVTHQLDIDARKYAESKERRINAGKKGGRPRKNNVESQSETAGDDVCSVQQNNDDEKPKKAMLFSEKHLKDIKPVDVYVDEDVDVDVDADVDADVLIYSGDGGEEDGELRARAEEIIHIFDDQYVTTPAELEKFQELTDQLFVRYAHRQPTEYDLIQVFENANGIGILEDDSHIAVYDDNKAELLRYAFSKAADADNVNWRYIEGIYANFRRRGIQCVDDAYMDNWERNYGPITA